MCWFVLEDIIYHYGNIGRMKVNQGKLDTTKRRDFFTRYEVQLKLTISYNFKANSKSKKKTPSNHLSFGQGM